jgi:hypothetical protein
LRNVSKQRKEMNQKEEYQQKEEVTTEGKIKAKT